jgi:2-keto-4-pentenoate hydratase/2-oxohepta-3-ene-1,7-dioic acid hydratase in catechol pathway
MEVERLRLKEQEFKDEPKQHRRVSEEEAIGYAVGIDLSARANGRCIRNTHGNSTCSRAKAFDDSCPLGRHAEVDSKMRRVATVTRRS